MLNISGLNQGVVIDHIKAGLAMKIYSYLNLDKSDCCIAVIKNAKSSKMGKKDIIKIEGPIDVDLDILGVLDHKITINVIEDGKTIVCGHWHASYGHSKIHRKCTEFGPDAIFAPFNDKGIMALDACTAHSGFVNCVVIEDDLLED